MIEAQTGKLLCIKARVIERVKYNVAQILAIQKPKLQYQYGWNISGNLRENSEVSKT